MANTDFEKHFLGTRDERYAKARLKERLILGFLCEETYSDSKNLAELIGLGIQSTKQTLEKMEQKGLIKSYLADLIDFGIGKKYWGITQDGEYEAWDVLLYSDFDYTKSKVRIFEKRMLSAKTIGHKMATQRLILNRAKVLELIGVKGAGNAQISFTEPERWIASKDGEMPLDRKKTAIPDAVFHYGEVALAIETELSIKSKERYKTTLKRYLFNVKKGVSSHVLFVLKTKNGRIGFQATLEAVAKSDMELRELVKTRFYFTSFAELTELLGESSGNP
jgi:DNA-binding PadR family transcriptional regulator